jgi:asparagine synthase (glutamine-hydrolysing)
MGAIFGILGPADASELARMSERLAHRGRLESRYALRAEVQVGVRRSGGPELPQGKGVLFDGSLDDVGSLAERLGVQPADVLSDPAAAIEQLYHLEGAAGLARLNGSFALAVWDGERGRLLLARDRFGARPLYYASAGERWAFASEYKALLALQDLPARPDRDAIQHLQCTKRRTLDSLLEGVHGVPCGGGVILGVDRAAQSFRYFEPRVNIRPAPASEHARALRESILRAARRQTAHLPKLGLLLSGGVDSTVTLAALRQVAPDKPIHTFTGGHGPEDPELVLAAEAARAFATEHHEVVLGPEELPELLPPVVWHIEDPVGREDNPYLYATAREAARHVPVLFGGHEADRLFGGMPRHKLVNAAYRLPFLRAPLRDMLRYSQTGAAAAAPLGRLLVAAYYRGSQVEPPSVAGARRFPDVESLERRGAHPLNDHLARGLAGYTGKQHMETLHSAFGLGMNSLFFDSDLVDDALHIPDHLKIRWLTREKYILKQACASLLPPGLARRGKSLQRLRHDDVFAEVLDRLADLMLQPHQVRERGLFEPSYIERVRRRPPGRPYPSEQAYRLWSLILTEIWARIFLDARGSKPGERDVYART